MRTIPLKNYIILGIISLVSILIVLFFTNWYKLNEAYKKELIIGKVLSEVKFDELDSYLVENPNIIIYTQKSNIMSKEFETEFRNYIIDNNLNKNMVYINLLSVDKSFVPIFNNLRSEELVKENVMIKIVPNIVVFEDRKIVSILNESKGSLKMNEVIVFLDKAMEAMND